MHKSSLYSVLQNRGFPSARKAVTVLFGQIKSDQWLMRMRTLGTIKQSGLTGEPLHPCVVNRCNTLVHARDLSFRKPNYYRALSTFAEREGYALLADRRAENQVVSRDRRQGLLPVIVLSMGLSAGVMAAEKSLDTHDSHTTLALFDARLGNAVEESTIGSQRAEAVAVEEAFEFTPGAEVMAVLRQHYSSSRNDPEYMNTDLQDMAAYFSRYPEAVKLLMSLKDQNWQLGYGKDVFETEVRGNPIQVKSVKVKFDTRAAAQLRSHRSCADSDKRGACVASPADALLHELLHVKSALLESKAFIAQGGMNSVIYPYAHERAVIRAENSLYKAMSAVDGSYRPNRHAHSGRVVASACVTCLN